MSRNPDPDAVAKITFVSPAAAGAIRLWPWNVGLLLEACESSALSGASSDPHGYERFDRYGPKELDNGKCAAEHLASHSAASGFLFLGLHE